MIASPLSGASLGRITHGSLEMTDTFSPPPAPFGDGQDAAMPPAIRILAQYIRDLSFENPRAPEALRGGAAAPQIDLGVELNAQGREGGVFEVELKLTAAARRDGEAVFQLELVYAGLFQIVGVEAEDLEQVLMIECPRYLFPFARRLISDLSAEGGFPPLMLEPMDFAAIYLARKAQAENVQVGNA
jgi:preprotein translocase subunit SecB